MFGTVSYSYLSVIESQRMLEIKASVNCVIFGPGGNTKVNLQLFQMLLEESEISVKYRVQNTSSHLLKTNKKNYTDCHTRSHTNTRS